MPQDYAGVSTVWIGEVPIPRDGDAVNERNCAPAWKRCVDRSAYLKRVLPTVYTWGLSTPLGIFWTYNNSGLVASTVAAGGLVDVPGCAVGDKIYVAAYACFARSGNITRAFKVWVDVIDDAAGSPAAQAHVAGALWDAANGMHADEDDITRTLSLSGVHTVTDAGVARFMFAVQSPTLAGADTFELLAGLNITAIRLPQ